VLFGTEITISQVAFSSPLLLLLLTVIEFSLGGSSLYTTRDKTNKNKYKQMKQYKNSTNNYVRSLYIIIIIIKITIFITEIVRRIL
jgi:steroid 5-alpha reductase family enzyme